MIVFRIKEPPELKSAAGAGALQRLRQRHTIYSLKFNTTAFIHNSLKCIEADGFDFVT
jgi:hypothetical protein